MKAGLDADVVVIGAGPIGTALAVNLGMNHVRTLVLETRGEDERPHAGTNATNARTMEHMRQWGVAAHFRATNPIDPQTGSTTLFVTRGHGHLLTSFQRPGSTSPLPFTCGAGVMGPQESIERALRRRLAELPAVSVRYGCSFERFEAVDDHVVVTYRDASGAPASCKAGYLVGADGSRSEVRRQLGIRMEGRSRIMRKSTWHIQSVAIRTLLLQRFGKAAFTWFANEDRTGAILIAQDEQGEFQYSDGPLEPGIDANDWDAAKGRLFRVLGAEVEVEPLFGGEVWLHSLVAPSFGHGRVFLAGEAAHLMSTYGGFGMNSGMGDVANLGWKLAAAVQGWAGPHLLDSYGSERIPVMRWIRDLTEHSATNVGPVFTRPGMEGEGQEGAAIREEIGRDIQRLKKPELHSFGAQFGAAYRNSPINVPDGTQPPKATFGEYTVSASPGMRAPHAWLAEDVSLFDHVAPGGFTFLRLDESIDTRPIELAAAVRGVPVEVVTPRHPGLRELYQGSLVLLRADHHVAWRADKIPDDPATVIDIVRGCVDPRAPHRLDVDGQVWAYEERGSGPAIVFLHGRLSGKGAWRRQMEALGARYRCIAFDFPGHGESPLHPDGWSMNDLVAAIPRLLDGLGEQQAALVGLSLGGAVAMRAAVTAPERVRALVTMGAGGDRPGRDALERQARLGQTLLHGSPVERREAVARRQATSHTRGWAQAHPYEALIERNLVLSYDGRAMAHVTDPKPDREPIDMEARFRDIRCPTLVVWGDEDVRASWGPRMVDAIPDARLVTIAGAGHHVTDDASAAATAALVEFMDGVHYDRAPSQRIAPVPHPRRKGTSMAIAT